MLLGFTAKSEIRPEGCAGPILLNLSPESEVFSNAVFDVGTVEDFLFRCASARKDTESNRARVNANRLMLGLICFVDNLRFFQNFKNGKLYLLMNGNSFKIKTMTLILN